MVDNTYSYHLSNSPIVETTIDIYCTFQIPNEAVIGIIYSLLRNNEIEVLKLEKLPICNIPEDIRKSDPNFKNKPTHQIICKEGVILIGPNNLSFGILPPYKSWEISQTFIRKVLAFIKNANIIKSISLASLKYLNFFKEINIFEKINLSITFKNQSVTYPSTIFRTEIPAQNGCISVLQITTGVHIKNQLLNLDNDGSLIDITIVSKNASLEKIENIIESEHSEAKSLFFDLLQSEFISSLV